MTGHGAEGSDNSIPTPLPYEIRITGTFPEGNSNAVRAEAYLLAGNLGKISILGDVGILIGSSEIQAAQAQRAGDNDPFKFTPRETQVIELVAQGMTNSQIAKTLGSSENAVKHHVGSILRKTGEHTRTAAATKYLSHNMAGAKTTELSEESTS